jgi:hypothetical protein
VTQDSVTGVVVDGSFLADMTAHYRIEHEVLTDHWSSQVVTVNVSQTEPVLVEREKPGQARAALELLLARCGASVPLRPLDMAATEAAGAMMHRHHLSDIALAHTAAIAAPASLTVFTTTATRYAPFDGAIDVFSLA